MLQLRDYQLVARDFLRGRDKAALFLDMGLGKTAAALSALEPRHLPALVVAPKRVAEHVWRAEGRLWRPDLGVAEAVGDPGQRKAALLSDADVVVLGRDNGNDLLGLQREQPFRTVILDELSGYKGRGVRWKTMRKVTVATPYVWGLTGTPSPNGLLDLWAQVFLLDRGARLGKTLTGYRDRYFTPGLRIPNGTIVSWDIRPGASEEIYGLIEDLALSMETEGRITLPPVTHNVVEVDLPDDVRRVYTKMKRDMLVDLKDVFGGEIHTAKNAAVLSSKLAQVSAGFLYVDDAEYRGGQYTVLHREKIHAAKEIVEGTDSPVLIFYLYQAELDMLKDAFPQARMVGDGDTIEQWNAGRVPVMLAHPASAGHGLNLQHGGHTMVWLSRPWDLEQWEQSNKRLARSGQKHPVVIHSIQTSNTVDAVIGASLVNKAAVQDSLLAHLESPL